MKNLTKLTAVLTLGLVVALSACKKSDSATNAPADKTDYKALSLRVTSSLYKSLNSGSAGFKANGTGTLRTNSAAPQCGDVVTTPTFYTQQNGDTTAVFSGKTIFTYICNNGVLNEYSLADTLTTQTNATGFQGVYTVAQKYNTRAIDMTFLKSVSNGKISAGYYQKLTNNNGVITDQLNWATHYTLNSVAVTRNNDEAVITGGQATFTSSVYHKDNVVDVNGYSDEHTGVITFQEGNIFKVTFTQGSVSRSYYVNAKTGVVTEA